MGPCASCIAISSSSTAECWVHGIGKHWLSTCNVGHDEVQGAARQPAGRACTAAQSSARGDHSLDMSQANGSIHAGSLNDGLPTRGATG